MTDHRQRGASPTVNSDAIWTLTLQGQPPVPITIDRVDGPTTWCHTTADVRFDQPGGQRTIRATLTAPDGSEEAGIGALDGVVRLADDTRATRLTFTEMTGRY
ncbi:hypothetical protein BJF78_18775 [Pseudonocardia sp. CNS-139]|nr:hypothetical protein BJF78_18775 [Pseudonocardia sp. CNS-139]